MYHPLHELRGAELGHPLNDPTTELVLAVLDNIFFDLIN
jgi:hypothetical protein